MALSERTTALLPQIIQEQGINVPIYKVEETRTLIRFYLYGRTKPLVVKKATYTAKSKTTKGKKRATA